MVNDGRRKAPAFVGQFLPELTDRVIHESTSAAMTTVVRRLRRGSQASSEMVLDRAGQIMVWDGDDHQEEMRQLGALIAGTFASTREMPASCTRGISAPSFRKERTRRSSPGRSGTTGSCPSSSTDGRTWGW